MKTQKSPGLLDWAIQDKVPAHVDLTARVMQKAAASQVLSFAPRMKTASIFLALASLIFISSVGYAVYRLVLDPGLQGVKNAGLVSTQGATALPTIQPTAETAAPPQAVIIAQSQVIEGVSLTLDWVYLDSTRFLSGLSFNSLPDGITPGIPVITFDGQPLGSGQQPVQYLHITASNILFLSNQVTNLSAGRQEAALEVNVPLLRRVDGVDSQVALFNFKVNNVPLYPGQTLPFQQTAAVSVNGAELQLRSIRLTPAVLEAVVCPSPVSSIPLTVEQASVSGDSDAERTVAGNLPLHDSPACRLLTFDAQDLQNSSRLTLTVNRDWSFSIDQPQVSQIPGVIAAALKPAAAPVAAESIDNLSLTLDWVYADSKRVAFGYTISGFSSLPDAFVLGGTIQVMDGQGNSFGGGMGGQSTLERATDQPGKLTGTWSTILQQPLSADQIQMSIDFTLDGTHGNDWNYTIGGPVYPLSGPTAEMMSTSPVVVPSNLVGTYHFETTARVYPSTVLHPAQVIEANGIQMELVQAELTPSYSNFILCYNKPTAKDWMLSNAVLTSGLEQTQLSGYTLLRDAQYGLKKQTVLPPVTIQGENLRCASVDFLLGHANQARTITLTIPALELSVSEVFPQAELDAAFAKLKQEGIEMSYISMRGTGGGGSTWQYTRLPEGMTEQQAYNRLIDVLGYLSPGPWTFTFEYKP